MSQKIETNEEWSERFLKVMPAGSLNEPLIDAIVEFRKAAIISQAIIGAVNGGEVDANVSVRETSFLFSLVTLGGRMEDVMTMVSVGLLSPDCVSTFASLKETWEK